MFTGVNNYRFVGIRYHTRDPSSLPYPVTVRPTIMPACGPYRPVGPGDPMAEAMRENSSRTL